MLLNLHGFVKSISIIVVLLLVSFRPDSEPDQQRIRYASTISADELRKHLEILASDAYEGRETAKKGQKMAAEYIKNHFKTLGIPELSTGGYEQKVPLIELIPGQGNVVVDSTTFQFGNDFYYMQGTDDQELKIEELIFAGYGINTKDRNDYRNLQVSGKGVLIFADEPITDKGLSRITGTKELSDWTTQRRRKTNEAVKQGARALFIIVPDFEARKKSNQHAIETTTLLVKGEKEDPRVPVLYISQNMANALFQQKKDFQRIRNKMNKRGKTKSFSINRTITISIKREQREISTENVLGYLEGIDLKNEIVVITAHYDHIGMEGNVVFNGADDDGTGTVAILELAEAFVKAKNEGHGPRRSILFMTVSGEEKGLLGSKWYSENPVFPLVNTVCDLNIDMIGRVDPEHEKDSAAYIYTIGSDRLSKELRAISETMNTTYSKIKLDYRYDVPNEPNNFYYRSDHYNFARKGIPVIFYFNGTHADYHKETDEVSKINFPLMERRTRLIFYTAWELANRNQRITVDKQP